MSDGSSLLLSSFLSRGDSGDNDGGDNRSSIRLWGAVAGDKESELQEVECRENDVREVGALHGDVELNLVYAPCMRGDNVRFRDKLGYRFYF